MFSIVNRGRNKPSPLIAVGKFCMFFLVLLSVPLVRAESPFADHSQAQLKGTVTLKRPLLPPKRYNLALNPDPYYCGRISDGQGWRIAPMPAVGPNLSLEGAIVYLEGIKSEPSRVSHTKPMTIKNCVFIPHIEVMHTGDALRIENWDPVQHQVEIFLSSQQGGLHLFGSAFKPHPNNRKSDYLLEGKSGVLQPGPEQFFHIKQPGVMFIRCNYHEYMQSWRLIVPHPYHASTTRSGEFEIAAIPPGSYVLKVWHPLGSFEESIHLDAHERTTMDIQILPIQVSPEQDDKSRKDPFGIDLVGNHHIVPTVEHQRWDPPQKKE